MKIDKYIIERLFQKKLKDKGDISKEYMQGVQDMFDALMQDKCQCELPVEDPLGNFCMECEKQLKFTQTFISEEAPLFEYEVLISDEGTPFEVNSWIPIATESITEPDRIEEYIQKGLLRKFKN